MQGGPPGRERYFEIDISPEVRRGVYANALNIWFTPYEFAFDWVSRSSSSPRTAMTRTLRYGSRS